MKNLKIYLQDDETRALKVKDPGSYIFNELNLPQKKKLA